MNYKEVWESIGKFFYTANFSLLISGLIVWDTSLLDLIPRIAQVEPLLLFIGVLMLLSYFIIDWLDANIVASIDQEVKLKDIIFWLIAPIFLSFTLTVLLKKGVDSYKWLYFGFNLYIFYNAIVLLFRNKLIYEKTSNNLFGQEKNRNKYDLIRNIQICDRLLGIVYLVFFIICNFLFFLLQIIILKSEFLILILYVITIGLNTFLKLLRFWHVNYEYYKMNKKK